MAGSAQDHRGVVAIDGPVAAGKTTVARLLANRLGATLFDTGVLYRAVTLAALREAIETDDSGALAELARSRVIDIQQPSKNDGRLYDVLLDGEDITWSLREPAVDASVSAVSAHPDVREALLPVQRRIAARGKVVMVGRDIGTVVVPDAGVKIFLNASVDERARRRFDELQRRGTEKTYEQVLQDLLRRDALDSQRVTSPLRPAGDAVLVETDGLDVDTVVAKIEAVVRGAWKSLGGIRQPA